MRTKLLLSLLLLALPFTSHAKTESQQTNKQTVIEFYQQAINKKDAEAAVKYLGPDYVQHNPLAQDGIEGLKNYIAYLKKELPQKHNEIKKVFADGDYVILHVKSTQSPDDTGLAIIDIFKLKDGKIIEHWDVIQPIPATSANNNGMF
ncbi:nuclear transport factor 2 family protein [Jinshanibacter sp. LJY008]|uniref:Nuclear transport factor 2 family protein n=1 Tax=Limnobaculum eriocheiris TaxID=2897391 RepID=A0A9X1MYL9_9GAMM|nr:nuclear transport factor 2 family protein [Limnobaculum eriocheiris]MCD1127015.1 nuclear transport factor 2 family protein [Limnobaculum eriocheiris]